MVHILFIGITLSFDVGGSIATSVATTPRVTSQDTLRIGRPIGDPWPWLTHPGCKAKLSAPGGRNLTRLAKKETGPESDHHKQVKPVQTQYVACPQRWRH